MVYCFLHLVATENKSFTLVKYFVICVLCLVKIGLVSAANDINLTCISDL